MSHTTRVRSKDSARSGMSRVLVGDSRETCPCDQGKPSADRHAAQQTTKEVPEAVVRWSRGQEFAVENVLIEQHNHVRLQHDVNRLVREPERMSQLALTAPNGNRRPF